MKRAMKYLLCALLLYAPLAFPADASICVQFGVTEKSQTIKNLCPQEIVVFWCHDDARRREGTCGDGNYYYRLNRTLKPGEVSINQYSLPLGANITHGACVGGYGAYKYTDNKGGYLCKPANAASGEAAITVSTASAATPDEACRKAKSMAGNGADPSECACDRRGQVSFCRVQTSGAKPAGSAVDAAREKLRELARCKPEDKDCKSQPSRNVGTGVPG